MVGGEDGGGGFSRGEEMPKIRACVAAADAARAIRIEWFFVLRVTGILDGHAPFAGIDAPVARGACGQRTIPHAYSPTPPISHSFSRSWTMLVSNPSRLETSKAFFGVSKCSEASRCERKRTPSSVILRRAERLKT